MLTRVRFCCECLARHDVEYGMNYKCSCGSLVNENNWLDEKQLSDRVQNKQRIAEIQRSIDIGAVPSREMIAAMCLQGLLASSDTVGGPKNTADYAIACTDALIRGLTK